jgi:hypothetical protein
VKRAVLAILATRLTALVGTRMAVPGCSLLAASVFMLAAPVFLLAAPVFLLAAPVFLLAAPAQAEVRRLEAVGTVPLKAGGQAGIGALEGAIQAALQEAVLRVARSFLEEADLPDEEASETDVKEVLGNRMVPYTARFRILDDQGERPAMFAEDPEVVSEYVVVVEVFVDADRVEQRLLEAGLLEQAPDAGAISRLVLEVRGVDAYGAYQAVRVLLTERVGALSAVPRGFDRGVAVFNVQLPGSDVEASDLAEQMAALGPPELSVRPLEIDERRAVVAIQWTPPPEGESSKPADRRR